MKKIILSLILLCFLASCGNSNVRENKNEEETTLNMEEAARVTGTDMTIEWVPVAYENENFRTIAKKSITADELFFNLLYIDIQAAPDKYSDKLTFIFSDIQYSSPLKADMTFAYVNKTGHTVNNINLTLVLEDQVTKERYIGAKWGIEGELNVNIPNNTAYYYTITLSTLLEKPVGTKLGQNDVEVYVENLTYDIVE